MTPDRLAIERLLKKAGINGDDLLIGEHKQTARNFLEACVMAAFDEIEEQLQVPEK